MDSTSIFAEPAVDVLCVGAAAYDLVFSVPHHPTTDEKMFASSLVQAGGGPAANAAVTVSRLGLSAAFAGYLGRDQFGDLHLAELMAEGVNTTLVKRGASPTSTSAILVKPGGERTVVNYRRPVDHLAEDSIDLLALRPKVVLFDGHEHLVSPPLAAAARKLGIGTVLDAGSVSRGTVDLLSKVDFAICSEKFAREFCDSRSDEEMLGELARRAPTVVITLGERGLIWENETGHGRLRAYEVNAVDTTGAGDTFHGAFTACLATGEEWVHALRFSSAAAALCCRKLGARPGIPTKAEVGHFLESGLHSLSS